VTALRILLVSPWVPWPPHDGARIRILNTVRHLARRHRVTLVAPLRSRAEPAMAARLAPLCDAVVTAPLPGGALAVARRALRGALQGRPLVESVHRGPALAAEIRRLTARDDYDIVQVEFSWFAAHLGDVAPGCRARTVLSMHNVESLRFARELSGRTTPARRVVLAWDQVLAAGWEERVVGGVDGVSTVSEADRRWVARAAPGAVVAVSPNGVDTEHFQPPGTPAGRSLIFTGAMNYPPNVDAATWFCGEIWPRVRRRASDVRLFLVGRSPAPRVRALNGVEGVRVTGEVPDVRPYLAGAAAMVVPLRSGGGTRLKILEAMAMARPVVSTTVGAEGLDVVDGRDLLLADTPADFARAVERVLGSPDLAQRLGEAGRRLVLERYGWPRCLSPLETLYERLLQPGGTVTARQAASA
jgi:sugar transferase (PEP-CTERM/EpsH1 system associated)